MKRRLFLGNLVFGIWNLFFCFLPLAAKAQLPVCSGPGSGIIYYTDTTSGTTIHSYNPSLPISSSNPSVNTILLPTNFNESIAVSENLNAASPSPTFYSILSPSGNYAYYNGTSWVNTGQSASPGYTGGIMGCEGGDLFILLVMPVFIDIMALAALRLL